MLPSANTYPLLKNTPSTEASKNSQKFPKNVSFEIKITHKHKLTNSHKNVCKKQQGPQNKAQKT